MSANGPERCPRCNAQVQPNQEYCLECGSRLARDPAGPVARASTTVSERHEWAGAWLLPALLGLVIAVLCTGAAIAISADGEEPEAIPTATGGSLTVTGTGTSVIDFGTTGATTVQFTSVNVTGSGTLSVANWTNAVDYFIANSSSGAQGTSPTNKVVFAGYVGNDTKWLPFNGGSNGQLTPVPEPSTYGALFLGGAAGLLVWRRRRRATSA